MAEKYSIVRLYRCLFICPSKDICVYKTNGIVGGSMEGGLREEKRQLCVVMNDN